MADMSGGNRELEGVLRFLRKRREKTAKRFAVLRWAVKVDYYDSEESARRVLACAPVARRLGLVDRETGETWSTRETYRLVLDTLRHQELTAPERFRRVGVPGRLKPERRRSF